MFRKALALTLLLSATAEAQIALRGCEQDSGTATDSVTITKPPGVIDTDGLMGFYFYSDDDAVGITPAESWDAELEDYGDATGGGVTVGAWEKIASSEGSDYTFDGSDGSPDNQVGGIVCGWSGIDTGGLLDVAYSRASHYIRELNDTTPTAQPITTATDDARVIVVSHVRLSNVSDMVCPADGYTWTEIEQIIGAGRNMNVCTTTIPTAGVVTPGPSAHVGLLSTDDTSFLTFALAKGAGSIGFSAGPTVTPATNGYTVTGTLSGESGTVYAVAVNPGAAVPNCTQVRAGDDGSNVDAAIAANEAWTVGISNNFQLAAAGAWPRHDVHVCGYDGSSDATAVTSSNNTNRSPDAGQTITALSSVDTTSPFVQQSENTCDTTDTSATITGCADTGWLQPGMVVDLSAGFADTSDVIVLAVTADSVTLENAANATSSNITISQDAYYSPSVAAGDVIEGDSTNSQGNSVTVDTDGNLFWADTCGGCFVSWDFNVQDVSDAVDGDLDSGPPEWATGDDTFYFGSTRPDFSNLADLSPVVLTEDAAMATISLSNYCEEPDSQAVTFEVRSGTVPNGTSISGAGAWTGTPDTEDETGVTLGIACFDAGGLATLGEVDVAVINTVTMIDVTGDTVAAAFTALQPVFWWDEDLSLSATFQCSDSVAENDIISQSPLAAAEVGPYPDFAVVVSLGPNCAASPARRRME